jgi:hypothetical protein
LIFIGVLPVEDCCSHRFAKQMPGHAEIRSA